MSVKCFRVRLKLEQVFHSAAVSNDGDRNSNTTKRSVDYRIINR